MAKYMFFCDPGHGWLRVSRSELDKLGILNQITHYSYQRGDCVFLEEDCDLSTFLMAKAARGQPVELCEAHTNRQSKIRGYSSFYCSTDR
jgi:hypothetical protein